MFDFMTGFGSLFFFLLVILGIFLAWLWILVPVTLGQIRNLLVEIRDLLKTR